MAEKIDELEVLITANTAQLKSGLKEVESKLSGIESSAGSFGSKLSAGAVAVGGIISSVFTKVLSQILANLDAGIARLDTLNNFTKVMGNLGIESGIAEQAINKLSDQLQGLPTSLSDAVSAVQRFTSANSSLQYSTDAFLAVNNAILAGGAGTQAQASALEQLAQAYSRNKMEMQDWKPILQAMPAQLKQVANYLNLASSSDLYDALQSGKVTMTDFMNAMIALNQNGINGFASFEDQARTATGGIQTSITNLKIAIQRGLANIMQVLGQSNIAGFFNRIASAIGTASNYIAAFIKLIKQAVAWIGALFGKGGSTTETVKETGSAMGGVASEAEAVGDNLDSANGSAKKLKHTLAGFDEMNVLTESESGGSGSSSSSSGSGGIDMSDYTWDTTTYTDGENAIEKAMKKLKEVFDKLFGGLDFDKIGESFKRFYEDVKKAVSPLSKILSDLWNKYLQPLVTWAGNNLLPAFLNALGGSLNMLGAIIDAVWDNALKPLIDGFLKPIAEFTGGVIVSVLNGIGDACRAIAQNAGAVEAISRTLGLLLDTLIAYAIVSAISTAFNVLGGAFLVASGGATALQASMTQLLATLAVSTGNVSALSAAAGLSSMSFSSLGTSIAAFAAKLGPAIIATEALVAVIEAVKVATEYAKLKEMEATLAADEYNAKIFDQTESIQACNDAIQAQIDLKDELLGIEKNLADQTLSLMRAQDAESASRTNATMIAQKFGMTLDEAELYVQKLDIASGELTESDRELAEAVYDLQSKEGTLKEAQDKVTESKKAQSEKTEELYNQTLKEWGMAKLSALQNEVNAGKYDEVAEALKNASKETISYTDENGRQCEIAGEDVENYTELVAQLLGRMDTDQSKSWKEIWESAGSTIDNIENGLNGLSSSAETNGSAITSGITKGINSGRTGVLGTIGSLASSISNKFKSILGIASPSKVFKEFGKFIDDGLAIGIDSESDKVQSSLESLADFTVPEIGINSNLGLGISESLEAAENKPISLLLRIDGEDIPISAERITNSLNDQTMLANHNFLTV